MHFVEVNHIDKINAISTCKRLQFFTGMASTSGIQGVGFQLSKAQPKDDPRPYLQYIVFATLLGADPENFEANGDRYGSDKEVTTL